MHSFEVPIKGYNIYSKLFYWKRCIRELDSIIQFDRVHFEGGFIGQKWIRAPNIISMFDYRVVSFD